MKKASIYRDGEVLRVFRFVDENEKPLSDAYLIDQLKKMEQQQRFEDCMLIQEELDKRDVERLWER